MQKKENTRKPKSKTSKQKKRKQNKFMGEKESQKGEKNGKHGLVHLHFLFSRQKVIQNNSKKTNRESNKNANGQAHFPFFPFLTFLFLPFILLLRLWDFADLLLGCSIFVFACLSFFSSWLILRISDGLVNISPR